MSIKVYDHLAGRLLNSSDVQLADTLLRMKKTKPLWSVIRYIYEAWAKSEPREYESFLFTVKDKRDTRINQYGSTRNKALRYTLDIPSKVYMLIRILYPVEELRMDKKFLREFAKRFPECRVAEKI